MNAEDLRPPVALVGAGPGDAALITVGGVARIAAADVVVYDRLANPALLRHARTDAELVYVGKTPARHTMSQDEINALLVERARAGKRVVRLKGGDPFVFGRGGEEAQALRAAGIPFEVVPGVTSAVAVPAYAGIPVTHRGIATSFAVVTGHEDASKADLDVDWARVADAADTLVLLMGVGRIAEIAGSLVTHGRPAETPVAVIEWGTLPRQRVVIGTLATIAADVANAGIAAPAVTVVGEVVRLRDDLRWYDNRPLAGKRVLVTRTREQASELAELLAAAGAEPVELPSLEVRVIADPAAVDDAIARLRTSAYTWAIFTSTNGVRIFFDALADRGCDARVFGRTQVAAIGPATADALGARGVRADLVPERFVAEGLIEAFAGRVLRGQGVLLPRAKGARDVLIDGLQARGAQVDELLLYEAAVPVAPDAEGLRRLRGGEIDIATFASSSSVRNLIAMLGGDVAALRNVTIAAIGPVTAQAVRAAGLEPAVVAEEHSIVGLLHALVMHCARTP